MKTIRTRGGALLPLSCVVAMAVGAAPAAAATIKEAMTGKKIVCGYDEFEIQPTGAIRITDALDEDVEFVSLPAEQVWKDDRAEFHLSALGKVYVITMTDGQMKHADAACHPG